MTDEICTTRRSGWLRARPRHQTWIAAVTVGGGAIVIVGTWLSWFSLFGGLQTYRGVDLLNGRLLTAGGALSILAGVWFFRRGSPQVRWGIGLLGFLLLAFASWSLFQLLIIYRQLSADPFMVTRLGPGLIVIVAGSLLIFVTLFLSDE